MTTLLRKLQRGLTKGYSYLRGGVVDESTYSTHGISRTVFWYEEDNNRMGDHIPFGFFLMNKKASANLPEDAIDYIFLHEVGHSKSNLLWTILFWPLAFLGLGLFAGGIATFSVGVYIAIQSSATVLTSVLFLGIITVVCAVAAALLPAVLWIDEGFADLYAISILGREEYLRRRELAMDEGNWESGRLRSILYRLRYPPQSLLLWVAVKRGIGE